MEHFANSGSKLNTAVVLAGGKSSRLPFDKQTLDIKGNLMPVFIANHLSFEFDRVIIVSNKPELYRGNCPYEVISDTCIGLGPKAGILTGLEHSTDEFVYFTGCDMPFVNLPFIRYMKKLILNAKKDLSVVISVKDGYYEPFNAFYSKNLIPVLLAQLNSNNNKITNCYFDNSIIKINERTQSEFDPHSLMFINLNTPKDLETFQSKQMLL
ncbi:MAG: molybdenum cofactor guanylyltransferase [Peptostreptococcaceae bacterium]|nr:molybdenum cofactor guanylyltransferase [Peptostreptococcaceae bacterium]